MSKREELLRAQDPVAASEWVEAEVHRWRSRAAELGQSYTDTALTNFHGFRHLPPGSRFNRVLAFGGGDGSNWGSGRGRNAGWNGSASKRGKLAGTTRSRDLM